MVDGSMVGLILVPNARSAMKLKRELPRGSLASVGVLFGPLGRRATVHYGELSFTRRSARSYTCIVE